MKLYPYSSDDERRLYNDLAWIWHFISPPEEYIEETELFARTIKEHSKIETNTLLHLGCGGGGNDFTLKKYFQVTGVDKSESMLNLARKLNPEVTYHTGDMRSVRLGKLFDAVAILDSIDYNRTQEDINATYKSAFLHLKPGGVFLTGVEYNPDNFPQNKTTVQTKQKDGLEITFIENNYNPDPTDTSFEATFIFLVRKKGKLEIHTDHHLVGLFKLEVWLDLLKKTGFEVKQLKFEHSTFAEGEHLPMLVGIKIL